MIEHLPAAQACDVFIFERYVLTPCRLPPQQAAMVPRS
jgi:hypothetical protein